MLSPCKRPDPIYRNPSSQDGPDHKLLAGVIIGLSIHVVMVSKINAARPVKAHMKTVKQHECQAKNAPYRGSTSSEHTVRTILKT